MKIIIDLNYHSFVDVITNSSSELFIVQADSIKFVQEFVDECVKANGLKCSGDGGDIDIYTIEDHIKFREKDYFGGMGYDENLTIKENRRQELQSYYVDGKIPMGIDSSNLIVVYIDEANKETINQIKNTFKTYQL